jgi:hypothetical protein
MKTYTLIIVYNEDTEEVEYYDEEVYEESTSALIPLSLADYWDEETVKLLKGVYSIAKA